jgi:hypothetical protein
MTQLIVGKLDSRHLRFISEQCGLELPDLILGSEVDGVLVGLTDRCFVVKRDESGSRGWLTTTEFRFGQIADLSYWAGGDPGTLAVVTERFADMPSASHSRVLVMTNDGVMHDEEARLRRPNMIRLSHADYELARPELEKLSARIRESTDAAAE